MIIIFMQNEITINKSKLDQLRDGNSTDYDTHAEWVYQR